jgi:hypothetical protein
MAVTWCTCLASWDASPDPYLDYYEVQYKVAANEDDVWQPTNNALEKDIQATVGPLSEGTEYSVSVRAVNTVGVASDWVSDNVTPNIAKFRNGSVWVDDFSSETPGRRWLQKDPNATGSFRDVVDPDASVGGRVGRFVGSGWWEFQDNIPFDPYHPDYVMRVRVRQLKAPTSGSKRFSIGVAGIAQVPGAVRAVQPTSIPLARTNSTTSTSLWRRTSRWIQAGTSSICMATSKALPAEPSR